MSLVVSCGDTVQKLWINDVALHAFGRIEQYWDGVLGSPDLFGDPLHVPLRPGAIDIPQIPGTRPFIVGMLTFGQDQAEHNDAWRDLARMLWSPEKALNIKRVVRFTTGDETHECRGKYRSGLDASMLAGGRMGKMAIRFENLDGYWLQADTTDVDITGSGSVTMGGDAVTRQISITLSGGSNQVLTNTTTGVVVSFLGSTTTPVALDVMAYTADQSGANVLSKVRHANDTFWMTLAPGQNDFTLTGGGTATISAKAAYL